MGTLLQNVVNIVFLLVAVSLLFILWGNTQDSTIANVLVEQIELVREENRRVILNNTTYLESKINTVAKNQNDYQYSLSRKIEILEGKVEKLGKESPRQRLINNNNLHNNLTINGKELERSLGDESVVELN